ETRRQGDRESGQQSGGQQGSAQQSGGQPNGAPNAEPQPSNPSQNSAAQPSPPAPKPPLRLPDVSKFSLATWIRWLMWAVLAAAAIIGFLIYHKQVIAFVRQLWAELLSLFGGRKPKAADAVESDVREPPRPFAAFRNPFYAGNAGRMSPDQLVRYTFDALEAWTFERAAARRREETPLEFAESLSQRFPAISGDVRQLARLYSQMLYARTPPTRDCLPALQRLWDEMSRTVERSGRAEAAVRG
ncbi:MAG TPA: DUF4129 domain-containing protein, partial [Pirellulales bacterium]|nr:DUF4129 domain-containing protein [Pirellulales bacterium]